MSTQPAELNPAAPAAPAAPAEPSTAVTAPTPTEPVQPDPAPPANPWDDPAAAKAEIEKLRRENGSARTNAKAQAAEDARKELAQSIGKILNPEADPMDPAKLTESLTASQADAKRARVELAVFRNAAAAGGDPSALLDSSSFLKALDSVDPNDPAAVTAAIETAIAANARLGAAPSDPRTPAPNPAQGASANGSAAVTQLTRADLVGMTPEAIETARLEGRLDIALGIKT